MIVRDPWFIPELQKLKGICRKHRQEEDVRAIDAAVTEYRRLSEVLNLIACPEAEFLGTASLREIAIEALKPENVKGFFFDFKSLRVDEKLAKDVTNQ